jgi:hypothetical protein
MTQAPTVGRVVHYVSLGTPGGEYTSQCRAAIVTEVVDVGGPYDAESQNAVPREPLGLAVFNPSGMFFNEAEHDEFDKAGGTWHWPERV